MCFGTIGKGTDLNAVLVPSTTQELGIALVFLYSSRTAKYLKIQLRIVFGEAAVRWEIYSGAAGQTFGVTAITN